MCDTYWDVLDETIYTVFCRLTKLRMQTDNLKSTYNSFYRLWEDQFKGIDLYCELSGCGEGIECFSKRVDAQFEAENHLKKIYTKFLEQYDIDKERELTTLAKCTLSAIKCLEREIEFHHRKLHDIITELVNTDLAVTEWQR